MWLCRIGSHLYAIEKAWDAIVADVIYGPIHESEIGEDNAILPAIPGSTIGRRGKLEWHEDRA